MRCFTKDGTAGGPVGSRTQEVSRFCPSSMKKAPSLSLFPLLPGFISYILCIDGIMTNTFYGLACSLLFSTLKEITLSLWASKSISSPPPPPPAPAPAPVPVVPEGYTSPDFIVLFLYSFD